MDCGFLRVGAVALLLLSFSFVSCSSLYGGSESGGIWVVAHRGGASLGAENTLPCIERAIEAGVDAVEVDVKYSGYIDRQYQQVEQERKLEERRIPADMDYSKLEGLRLEAREKLEKIKPLTVGMASRISGVNPADITVLLMYLK